VDLDPLGDEDDMLVQGLISNHVTATGSVRGQWILDHWASVRERFVKVFPHDYKRVLGLARSTQPEAVSATEKKEVVHG
jgi:glutamate synthase domain-containing protein 3